MIRYVRDLSDESFKNYLEEFVKDALRRGIDIGDISAKEYKRLEDSANMFKSIIDSPTYVSFYTGWNGSGGVLKERYFSKRKHYDSILEREAIKKGKKLGASSFVCFKSIGVPVNLSYRGYDSEEARLDYIEEVSDNG